MDVSGDQRSPAELVHPAALRMRAEQAEALAEAVRER
jgi:hypothetical protein